VTELYTKAVDQLGHEKAAVRLGGLYALERLAQGNPDHRQTIVNVLCAYLRMPTAPGQPPDEASPSPTRPPTPPADSTPADDPAELSLAATEDGGERQVRLTAQRILTDHLKPGPNPQPAGTFWQDI